MQEEKVQNRWWKIVQEMAGLVANGCNEADLTEHAIRQELVTKGFDEQDVAKACEWVEKSSASGTLLESLGMLQPHATQFRVSHPVEKSYFSDELWNTLSSCRSRGLIAPDLFEKLLEGVRCLDTRGWDDEDICAVMAEMYHAVLPQSRPEDFFHILSGKTPQYYC